MNKSINKNFFIFLAIILSILNISRGDTTRDKLTQLIQQNDKIVKFGRDPETIFTTAFQRAIKDEQGRVDWRDLTIINNTTKIGPTEEYRSLFNRSYNENDSAVQHDLENSLVESICAFYGIERKDLIEIRQNKHLISKKKKEINELFITNLKTLEDKFNRDKIIEAITEKVLQKQNESTMPTVPDCPPLI